MIINAEIQVKLESEIKYVGKDDAVLPAKYISLRAPTTRSLKYIAPIKQIVTRCLTEQSFAHSAKDIQELRDQQDTVEKDDDDDDDDDFDGSMIIVMIAASKDVDYGKFLDQFITVLKNPDLASIEGEVKLNSSFIDQLSFNELELLAGEYIGNFILPSLQKD